MTTIHVRRTTIILSALFLSAAAFFGAVGRRPAAEIEAAPAGVTGEAARRAFDERCGACHEAGALGQAIRNAPDRRARLAAIEALLTSGHGDASASEAAAILGYLDRVAGGQ